MCSELLTHKTIRIWSGRTIWPNTNSPVNTVYGAIVNIWHSPTTKCM